MKWDPTYMGSFADWFSGVITLISTAIAVWLSVRQYIRESKDRMARKAAEDEQRENRKQMIRGTRNLVSVVRWKLKEAINEAQKPDGHFDSTLFDNLRPLITQVQVQSESIISMQYYQINELFNDAITEFKSKTGWRRGLVTRETVIKMGALRNTLLIVDRSLEREYMALT